MMPKILLQPESETQTVDLEIAQVSERPDAHLKATIGDRRIEFERLGESATQGCLLLQGRVVRYYATRRDNEIAVWVDGRTHRFQIVERVARRAGGTDSAAAASNRITAPMPGTILKLVGKPGTSFAAKEPLVIMESMKMEMSLTSPAPGRIVEFHCAVGHMVDRGALLATLDLDAEAG